MNLFALIQTVPVALPDSVPSVRTELSMLKSMPIDELIDTAVRGMVKFAISFTIAILVFYAGKYIIRKLYNLTAALMLRRKVDRSLSTFVLSLVRILLYFILIVTVIGILGINTSSFIAIFASAGVAIGMALSGTLQNFAGGVLILLLKPYRIGDYIETEGYAGTVKEIQIFSTIISTPDNKSIIIPNGGLSTGSINNWSREEFRRVDWNIAISYGDDVQTARNAILEMLVADSRILNSESQETGNTQNTSAQSPASETSSETQAEKNFFYRIFHSRRKAVDNHLQELTEQEKQNLNAFIPKVDRTPVVYLGELADSSVNLKIRAWVRTSDYWVVYYHFNELFYNELPKHGINFPFPQLDVHLPNH